MWLGRHQNDGFYPRMISESGGTKWEGSFCIKKMLKKAELKVDELAKLGNPQSTFSEGGKITTGTAKKRPSKPHVKAKLPRLIDGAPG